MGEWINKQGYIHIMEYDSAIKCHELLKYTAILMNLKGIILSKRNQSQKATYCTIPLI